MAAAAEYPKTMPSPSQLMQTLLAETGAPAAILFGSAARRSTLADAGDVDVVVVLHSMDDRHRLLDVTDGLSERLDVNLVASATTFEHFAKRLGDTPSFGIHLADEGQVVGTPADVKRIKDLLADVELTPESVAAEAGRLERRIAQLSDEAVLGGRFVTALGRLFAIGRAASILRLLQDGVHVYDWQRAAERLAALYPELAEAVANLDQLRPYYEALDGRRPPPTESIGTHDLWRAALVAAERLVAATRLPQHA